MTRQYLLVITLLLLPRVLLSQGFIGNQPLFSSVFFEPGYRSPKLDLILTQRPGAELAHQYLITSYAYLGAGLKITPGTGLEITLAGQLNSFKAIDRFLISNMDPLEYDVPFDQFSAYLSARYLFRKHWRFFGAAHLLSAVRPIMVWQELPLGGEFIAVPDPYHDWLAAGGLEMVSERLQLLVSGSYAKFNSAPAVQADLGLTLFPFANLNTRIEGRIILLADTLSPQGRFVGRIGLAQKLIGNLWAEAGGAYGMMQNYHENDGFDVSNIYDPETINVRFSLIYKEITRNLSLSVRYAYSKRWASWYLYQYGEYLSKESAEYSCNSLTAGITWRF
jgi:hypothetical protein